MGTVIKIDVTKIPKHRLFVGAKGKYLDLRLVENKGGKDQYGNDGFVAIDLPKTARDAGEQGEIIGNFKVFGPKPAAPAARPPAKPAAKPPADLGADLDPAADDDVPF